MQKLQVPDNISLRKEFLRGVGVRELLVTFAITAAAIVAAVLFCGVSQADYDALAATVFVVLVLAFCLGFFAKLDSGQSIYDYLRQRVKYRNSQQTFLFVYKEVLTYLPKKEKYAGEYSDRAGIREC